MAYRAYETPLALAVRQAAWLFTKRAYPLAMTARTLCQSLM